ncbi:MAG: folate-binding protein YgfZ [Proteobacteria bacterium]|nr:folate-binding protein YgfZ [Pseudomonadota bacterium]
MTHKFTQLHRSLIHITGPDRFSFFQGLITQDIEKLSSSQSLYSLLLTPQGRFLYDFFLIPANSSNSSFFLEIDSLFVLDILKRLTLYKLRSNVSFEIQPNLCVFAYWIHKKPAQNTLHFEEMISYQDPRLEELGGRLISSLPKGQNFLHQQGFSETSFDVYQSHLLSLGIPSSPQDMIPEKSIPLECGMEELNALSWTKGCYMGQELTARTHHQGLVRKRLIPGRLEETSTLPLNAPLLFENQEAGFLRSSMQRHALALIRLEFLKTSLALNKPFQIRSPQEENKNFSETDFLGMFMPFLPPWMKLPNSMEETNVLKK